MTNLARGSVGRLGSVGRSQGRVVICPSSQILESWTAPSSQPFENATALSEAWYKYLKVRQKAFKEFQPDALADLEALEGGSRFGWLNKKPALKGGY